MEIRSIAKEVFDIESESINNLSSLLTDDFENAIKIILDCKGKLIVCGMGKSGLIGKKIAATLSSTGTSSFFLHPGEAYHGDLGMIEKKDILLLLSNSGETDEILKIIPFLKNQRNIIVSMTGNPESTLAKNSDYHLNVKVRQEACPLSLAPTSSTTATLVMGDALAVALMKLRVFQESDFAKFHPGGSLGRRLLTIVEDVMKKEPLPICKSSSNIKDIIHTISSYKFGLVVIVDEEEIKGIITDGDIRRAMEENQHNFFTLLAPQLMSTSPKTIDHDAKLMQAQQRMSETKINSLLVTKHGILVGIIQIYDLGL